MKKWRQNSLTKFSFHNTMNEQVWENPIKTRFFPLVERDFDGILKANNTKKKEKIYTK